MEDDSLRILVIDTETTGLFDVKNPDEYASNQPYAVQVAALMFDPRNDHYDLQFNKLVKLPHGFPIEPAAMAVHRISNEIVEAHGESPIKVYSELRELVKASHRVMVYNLPFDERIIRTSSVRACPGVFDDDPVLGDGSKLFCAMDYCSALFKHPYMKLEQAYRRCFGTPIKDAHDAMADAIATAEVFRKLTSDAFEIGVL
ncbi:MAG: exonuclease domain-containing protein [Betaproteobacteria bacterium]